MKRIVTYTLVLRLFISLLPSPPVPNTFYVLIWRARIAYSGVKISFRNFFFLFFCDTTFTTHHVPLTQSLCNLHLFPELPSPPILNLRKFSYLVACVTAALPDRKTRRKRSLRFDFFLSGRAAVIGYIFTSGLSQLNKWSFCFRFSFCVVKSVYSQGWNVISMNIFLCARWIRAWALFVLRTSLYKLGKDTMPLKINLKPSRGRQPNTKQSWKVTQT